MQPGTRAGGLWPGFWAFKFGRSSWIISPPPPLSFSPAYVLLLSCGSRLSRLTMAVPAASAQALNTPQCVHCRDSILLVILSQMIQFRSVCNHHTPHLFNEIFLSFSRPMRDPYYARGDQWSAVMILREEMTIIELWPDDDHTLDITAVNSTNWG